TGIPARFVLRRKLRVSQQLPSFGPKHLPISFLRTRSKKPKRPSPKNEDKLRSKKHTPSHTTSSIPSSSYKSKEEISFSFPSPPRIEECKAKVTLPSIIESFQPVSPISLGGLIPSLFKQINQNSRIRSFKGCIRNFRINEELQDLGHSLISHNSSPGCKQDHCKDLRSSCGLNGRFLCRKCS
ncbi:hypothetical protein Avbf_13155, partial [Armadillidium vulgare]